VRDSERFLGTALVSALGQSRRAIEIIVVDDGSETDACERVVRGLSQEHLQTTRYFYQHNQGPSAARNRGLAQCAGDFVAFLDSDDFFEPGKLETQAALLGALPQRYACVSGAGHRFYEGSPGVVRDLRSPPFDGDIYLRLVCREISLFGNPGYHLFRRRALESVGGYCEDLWLEENHDLLIRLARKYAMKSHPETVFRQRRRRGSLSDLPPQEFRTGCLRLVEKLRQADPFLTDEMLRPRVRDARTY
jgi:glycosyltransferase involved in cell wall biosynthesis